MANHHHRLLECAGERAAWQISNGANTSAGSGSGAANGLFHTTLICLERNIVRNTLADTPSGYTQDPRVAPKIMVQYNSVSRIGAAAVEAMEREKELLEREELAYRGYTTLRIQELKRVVMEQGSMPADLTSAVEGLTADLADLIKMVGQEVEMPMSKERILLLKWQQRQQRLQDREDAFRVAPRSNPGYRVVQQADGTEVLERPGRDTPQMNLPATDEAYLSQPVEMEELPASVLVLERTVATIADVNHVRYLIALALRRLSRFEEAEKMLYDILEADVTNVDAIESLLEMDLGVEGWEPRIRVLLDFLVIEYDKAVLEGRLQLPYASGAGSTDTSNIIGEEKLANEVKAAAAAATAEPLIGSTNDAHDGLPSAASHDPAGTATITASSMLPTPTSALTPSQTAVSYATVPQAAPIEVALALLSDIIVEAAARKCATDGEGATSRFFIESLGPIVRVLGRDYAPSLLESLFQAVDEQHFIARFDSDDVSPAARTFALHLVVAFLKALTARRIHEMLPHPVRFEFFTLSKLHAALRRCGRLHESYSFCEKMMKLYRAHSSVHRARMRRNSAVALSWSASSFGEAATQRPEQRCVLPDKKQASEEVEHSAEALTIHAPPTHSPSSTSPSASSPSPLKCRDQLEGKFESAAAPTDNTAVNSAMEAALDGFAEPPDVLDDQDSDYREAFFQYVNDRARDSSSLGRCLCLEAMQEFPSSAAPWETLALLLHRENPKKNLLDAIIAARHAMLLEPLRLSAIVTLANLYKAAHRYELHERMLDRYRLLVYMSEEGASVEDMMATAAEVEALDRSTPEVQDLVKETSLGMSEYIFRMEQAMTYSMPIDKETRHFQEAPVRLFSQQADMRPPELGVHESEPEDGLWIGVAGRSLT
ncbi:hypothetical protein ABL78_3467 [Leptomonas seymouri]|uniref:Uncharacterized protein n=1 Tax=Leptomonas seymouri TaxID=5684 RepID=A0A0N0P6B3_LEPSE|nr:hypothetical protein ABL78_3467 [Leptomonas seymouri]|eukprot:KPI87436.1 hypothetical protein ABL78_3467 [Leptomonas seymouri]